VKYIISTLATKLPYLLSPPIWSRLLPNIVFDVHEINAVMANVDILRMNIYWLNCSSGRFVKSRCLLWTENQCCCYKNSKPSFSTNVRPISIQKSIRCTRDQCCHFEYRYSQNENILFKLVIRMCIISVLVDCCMTSTPNDVLAVDCCMTSAVATKIPNHLAQPF
jgi:hypothetical protein